MLQKKDIKVYRGQGWCEDVDNYEEQNSLILTSNCKFSNFFIESLSLGSEVCGQGDTIRASLLLGSACI